MVFTPRLMSPAPSVSVIVPALNAVDGIGPCLESLRRQHLPGDEFEVIVVDNGSTDGTLEVARSFPVQVVSEPRRGRSRARNLGARLAQGSYLAFIDVDCEAPADWLAKSLAALSRSWLGAVQARVQKPGFAAVPEPFTQAHYYRPFLDTCAMVTTRSAFEHARGFDEELRRTVDMDYSFRLLSCGYAFAWLPRVVMTKHHQLNPRQIVRRGWDGGKSLSELARKWPRLTPQTPLTLWRDRGLSWARTVVKDARHPLQSRGKNALEGTLKLLAAAVTDLQRTPVSVESYALVTRLHEVLGSTSSLVVSEDEGLIFDAKQQALHRLSPVHVFVLSGLIDGTGESEIVTNALRDTGSSESAVRAALAEVRDLSRRLLQPS